MSFNADFIEVLYKFACEAPHNGHQLDSALTYPILEIIESNFVALYERHKTEISDEFMKKLRDNETLLNSFIGRLTDKVVGKISDDGRQTIIDTIGTKIQDTTSSQTADAVAQHVALSASTVIGSQVATLTASAIVKTITAKIGMMVGQFLASAAFKKIIVVIAHRLIVGAVTSTVIHFLAAHIGSAISASTIMWIIIPIATAILIKQIRGFPRKLGKEVSQSIRQQIAESFETVIKNTLEQVFDKVFCGDELLESVAQDKDVEKALKELG